MPNHSGDVDQFMKELDHPLKAEIEELRAAILRSNDDITEHIKWKAPSFCYKGDDRVTFRLRPEHRTQLVFHRGAKVKDTEGFVFEDPTDLLEWVAADRAVVSLRDADDVDAKGPALVALVNQWMKSTT